MRNRRGVIPGWRVGNRAGFGKGRMGEGGSFDHRDTMDTEGRWGSRGGVGLSRAQGVVEARSGGIL